MNASGSFVLSYVRGPDRLLSNREFLVEHGEIISAGKKGLKLRDTGDIFTKKEWRVFATENTKVVDAAAQRVYESLSHERRELDGRD